MPNWTLASDYDFVGQLDATGWCWQFMRRNPAYREDFAEASKPYHIFYDPPLLEGESLLEYVERTGNEDPSPADMHFARKWAQLVPMQDPDVDSPPAFVLEFPRNVGYDEALQYFERPTDIAPIVPREPFLVMVFRSDRPVKPQVAQAERLLSNVHDGGYPKSASVQSKVWPTYLRLLDALEAGAEPSQIKDTIEDYATLDSTVETGYQQSDTFSDHKKRALALRNDPLSILKSPHKN